MENRIGLTLIYCPSGSFSMGSPASEKYRQGYVEDQVSATISQGFYLGKYSVTQAEYKAVMGTTPWAASSDSTKGDDCPATNVSWYDAAEFCRRLTEREAQAGRLAQGYEFALPTEAQREYACRAGTTTAYSFGDDAGKLGEYAWCGSSNGNQPLYYAHPVGRKKPNPWGLYDMQGNVWEWCLDAYDLKLPGGIDPFVGTGEDRVFRGAIWGEPAMYYRSARRQGYRPSWFGSRLGFRVALVPSIQFDRFAIPNAARCYGEEPGVKENRVIARCDPNAFKSYYEEPDAPMSRDPRLGFRIALVPSSEFDQADLPATDVIAAAPHAEPGKPWKNSLGSILVYCPSGSFTMGSPAGEKGDSNGVMDAMQKNGHSKYEDQVQVTISAGFYLGKYSVTQAEFKAVMGATPWAGIAEQGDDCPATYVQWSDATEFCRKLNTRERLASRLPQGFHYALPTEAQREYACRAGTTTAFSFGDDPSRLSDYGWFNQNSGRKPHRVGQKKPNPWGLYDLHGNVWEWCLDPFNGVNRLLPGGTDPLVAVDSGGGERAERGGSCDWPALSCRSASRSFCGNWAPQGTWIKDVGRDLGFRIALVPFSQ